MCENRVQYTLSVDNVSMHSAITISNDIEAILYIFIFFFNLKKHEVDFMRKMH